MPFIHGRFYANPAYGEALESVRRAEAPEFVDELLRNEPSGATKFDDGVLSNDSAGESEIEELAAEQHQAHGHGHAKPPETPVQRAIRIYNETSSLRPTTQRGPGSANDLSNGRDHMGHAIVSGENSPIPPKMARHVLSPREAQAIKSYPPAHAAYQDSLRAAQQAGTEPDPNGGATHFYLDYGQSPPPWAAGKKPVASFGPFRNVAGGGDVPKGAMVRIVIIR
jgi:hypothetical protein